MLIWFSQRTSVSSTNAANHLDITEIMLQWVLSTLTIAPKPRLLNIINKDMYYIETSKSVELLHIIAKEMHYIDNSSSVRFLHIIANDMYYIDTSNSV